MRPCQRHGGGVAVDAASALLSMAGPWRAGIVGVEKAYGGTRVDRGDGASHARRSWPRYS